jgi:hypothetical protein
MSNESLKETFINSTSDNNSSLIPDPWELPSPNVEIKSAQSWQIPRELHPLLSGSGNPSVLQLASPKFNAISLLLQDWLKLKTQKTNKLATKIKEALGLLYWLETT